MQVCRIYLFVESSYIRSERKKEPAISEFLFIIIMLLSDSYILDAHRLEVSVSGAFVSFVNI